MSDKINIAGPGTYEQQGYIYSKLAGTVKLTSDEKVSLVIFFCFLIFTVEQELTFMRVVTDSHDRGSWYNGAKYRSCTRGHRDGDGHYGQSEVLQVQHQVCR